MQQLAEWIPVHGEAIYETRPWLVYGEGGVRYKGGHFKEDFNYSAKDIRFTTKGPTLYAIALGWPEDGRLLVRSLATPAGKVTAVSLLGHDGKVEWQQTDEGLVVTVPAQKVSEYTCALKITGEDLKPAPIPEVAIIVSPDAQGSVTLNPDDAELHGDQIKIEAQGGQPNVGFWDKPEEWVSWQVKFDKPGKFQVSTSCATVHADAEFVVEAAGQSLSREAAPHRGLGRLPHAGLGPDRGQAAGRPVGHRPRSRRPELEGDQSAPSSWLRRSNAPAARSGSWLKWNRHFSGSRTFPPL